LSVSSGVVLGVGSDGAARAPWTPVLAAAETKNDPDVLETSRSWSGDEIEMWWAGGDGRADARQAGGLATATRAHEDGEAEDRE